MPSHYQPPCTIVLAGQRYLVRRDPETGQRFVGDEAVEAFIERMTLLCRYDVLAALAAIGRAKQEDKLVMDSPQQTAFALHQQRTRRN